MGVRTKRPWKHGRVTATEVNCDMESSWVLVAVVKFSANLLSNINQGRRIESKEQRCSHELYRNR